MRIYARPTHELGVSIISTEPELRHTIQTYSHTQSITAPIARPILPPLVRLLNRTIKHLLAQPNIHLIMPLAQPPTQPHTRTNIRRVREHLVSEVRGAVCAGVEHREGAQEAEHVGALRGRRAVGVVCSGGVEEGPGCASELLDVWWTVWGAHGEGRWRCACCGG